MNAMKLKQITGISKCKNDNLKVHTYLRNVYDTTFYLILNARDASHYKNPFIFSTL